jgi:peptidyl-dipeptidase Dcp
LSKLRKAKANLLGYASHADFVLEKRMAKNTETVLNFLNDLLDKSLPFAQKELNDLTNFARAHDGPDVLQRWDLSYYAEKLKTDLYEINSEILKPFFQLENVVKGVFSLSKHLFGLTFKINDAIPVYHPDVKVYEVLDENDEFVALFYADFFPRPGKRQGAWMTSFQNQFIKDGINHRPHVSIVCNFTKPIEDTPSLLTFDEVTTLFHEFGHALHGMLANTTYPSLSGTSVYWDFVELPSQLLENWCYEADCLQMFAKHYQTGKLIPMEYVERIKKASQFNAGLATVRQVGLGLLDMAWHTDVQHSSVEVSTIERNAIKNTNLLPLVEGTCISTQFSHIFQGGYASGYYSYKWAEVLDADAFEYFIENGILNKEIAKKLKETVLSKGGTIAPSELYRSFRGKNPDPAALLRRSGLLP